METPSISVTPWRAEADIAELAGAAAMEGDVVILPVRLGDDNRGVYRESHVLTVKDLRGTGVRARYLHASGASRTFQGEHSAELVGTLALWVLSSASWDALKKVAQYVMAWGNHVTGGLPNRHVSVSIARLERSDGARLEGVEVSGAPDDVARRLLAEIAAMLDPASGDGD